MFEISMMSDFPYKNAWGTLSLGVEEIIDLWCVFYINSQLASTNPGSDQFISARYFLWMVVRVSL